MPSPEEIEYIVVTSIPCGVSVGAVEPCANGNHRLLAVTVCWKVVAMPTDFCASQKRPGSATIMGTNSTAANPPAAMLRRSRVARGAASSTGNTASAAHCFVAIAQPSIAPASRPRPRVAAITAPTHSAAASSSSGCPYSRAL